jgi:hypothetical protein
VTEAEGGLTLTFVCFPFTAGDGAATSLFAPVLILSTPALDAVTIAGTVTMVFDTAVTEGATALRGTLVLGATPAFDAYVAWVALARTVIDEATLAPFGAIDAFAGTTF